MRLQHSIEAYSIDVLETMVRRCQLPDEPQLIYTYLQKIEKLAEKSKNKPADSIFALGQRAAEILYECAADQNLPGHHRMLSIDNIYRPLRLMSNSADSLTQKDVLLNLRYRLSALNPIIGYAKAADIAKKAYAQNRPILDVALEMTDLSEQELKAALDPVKLTKGGM